MTITFPLSDIIDQCVTLAIIDLKMEKAKKQELDHTPGKPDK